MAMKKIKRVYPKRVKKPETAEDMFRIIRDFMHDPTYYDPVYSDHRRKFWDAITALRGPDHGYDRIDDKSATTAVIRRKLLGDCTLASNYADIFGDAEGRRDRRLKIDTVNDHFGRHALLGFEALGMNWLDVNKM